MKYAVTLPGKIGDILWALPTVREIARESGEKVRLIIPAMWKGVAPLLKAQDYVGEVTELDGKEWPIRMEAPIQPWYPPGIFHRPGEMVINLGHSGWPSAPLPFQYWLNLAERWPGLVKKTKPDMSPWIQPHRMGMRMDFPQIYYGMSEQWIELKAGVLVALAESLYALIRVPGLPGGRHMEFEFESRNGEVFFSEAGWIDSARIMSLCHLYVGCCSSQWVLACAMGVPVVLFDPDPGRHNEIFWWDGEGKNEKVIGSDGQPTWDARAVVQAVREKLHQR